MQGDYPMDEKTMDTERSAKGNQLFPDELPSNSDNARGLEEIFEDEPQTRPQAESAGQQTTILIQQLSQIQQELKPLAGQIAEVNGEIKRIKTEQRVLTEMHDRCRELGEQHYQREVLGPLFHCAIGIADRCRQQVNTLRGLLSKHTAKDNKTAMQAIRYLLDARQADHIEIESLLANYGVEPFENPDDKFDSSIQKCISRTETKDGSLAGNVSQRLLPGYRREERIIRQEYVSVYVLKKNSKNLSKGEGS